MKRYVLNRICEPDGHYYVHESSCYNLPAYTQQEDLGYHSHCGEALEKARKTHPNASGCYHCNRSCHPSSEK